MTGPKKSAVCPVCASRSRDGHLCHRCVRDLIVALDELPWLWLETQRAGVGMVRLTERVGARSTTTSLPGSLDAAELANRIRHGLIAWVQLAVEDLGAQWPAGSVTAMCTHLAEQMPGLRKHEAAADLVSEIHNWTQTMLATINRPSIRRIPVGPCPLVHDDGPCPGTIYATFPADTSPYAACDTCADTHTQPATGIWDATQWTTMGRQINARKAEIARQRALAESLTRGARRAS